MVDVQAFSMAYAVTVAVPRARGAHHFLRLAM